MSWVPPAIMLSKLAIAWFSALLLTAPNLYHATPVENPQPIEQLTTVEPLPMPQFKSFELAVASQSDNLMSWLEKLRNCESGSSGLYLANTGNGYYGAYQFSESTWNSWNTGYARADLAPPSVQDETIIKNTNRSGDGLASQNPGCLSRTGISAFPPA